MTQEAIQFIKSNRDKPFFVNYWAFSVHAPYDAKKELIEKYRAKAAKLPPGSPQRNAVYGAMVQSLDENVGRLLDTLDELKLSDNTIIVFFSDNGGVHWSAGKGDAAKVESTDIPITSNAPYPFQHGWSFGTAWADAGVICPWAIWQAYGDTRIIERCWPDMVEFMNWRKSTSKDFLGINHGNDWVDWLSFGTKTPLDYVDTVYFAYSTKLMADMAATIGKQSEAAEYRELLGKIKTAFNAKYVKPDGLLAVDTQTAYALAIYMDLLPADVRAKSGKILANKLRSGETADNSGMTTGFIGTRPLLPVLSSVGEHDLAVKHFQSHKFPSWGYEVNQGATTIWERWNSYTKDKGFGGEQNASMNSFSHYAFGAVCEWMFFELAGIDSDGPGYRKVIIRPSPPTPGSNPERAPIDWVKAHYDSIHGRIVSNWRLKEGRFELETTIPANTTATVYLPTIESDKITESGKLLAKAKGVKLLRVENNRTVLAVESGTYRFDCAEFKGATSGTMAAAK